MLLFPVWPLALTAMAKLSGMSFSLAKNSSKTGGYPRKAFEVQGRIKTLRLPHTSFYSQGDFGLYSVGFT